MNLYEMLPNTYKINDYKDTLKRFLSVFEEELGIQLKDTQDLANLIDVDKCPIKYLPLLCETFGIGYDPDIPERFQRRFLKNIVSLYKKKGTASCLTYLARELSGFSTVVTKDVSPENTYRVTIQGIDENDPSLLIAQGVIQRYLTNYFTPVGANVIVVSDYQYTDKGLPSTSPYDEELSSIISCLCTYTKGYTQSISEYRTDSITLSHDENNKLRKTRSSIINNGLINSTLCVNIVSGIDVLKTLDSTTTLIY